MLKKIKFGVFLILFNILTVVFTASAAGVRINGASYDGFGRIEFDWTNPVKYELKEYDGEIFITFSGIIDADPEILEQKLPDYISRIYLSSDLKTIVIKLIDSFKIRHFSKSGIIYVDIVGKGDYNLDRILKSMNGNNNKKSLTGSLLLVPQTPKKPELPVKKSIEEDEIKETTVSSNENTVKPKIVSQPKKKPARKKTKAVEPELAPVIVRGGKHDGYERVVFEWKAPPKYHVNEMGDTLEFRFDKRAEILNPDALKRFPENLRDLTYSNRGNSFFAYVPLKEGSTYKTSVSRNKLIIDIFYAPETENKTDDEIMTVSVPAKEETKNEIKKSEQSEKKKAVAAVPAPQNKEIEQKTEIIPNKEETMPIMENYRVEVSEPALARNDGAVLTKLSLKQTSKREEGKKFAVLTLPFSHNQKLAVFKRHGIWWIVFSEKIDINPEEFRENNDTDIIKDFNIISNEDNNYTVIRMLLDDNIDIAARKDGSTWFLDLYDGNIIYNGGIKTEQQGGIYTGAVVHLPVRDASQPLMINDPEVGDALRIICVSQADQKFITTEYYPDFELDKTVVGLVVGIRDTDTGVYTTDYGVDVKKNSGLLLSAMEKDLREAKQIEEKDTENSKVHVLKLFDIADLQVSAKDGYYDELFKIKKAIIDLDKKSRNRERLRLARFYLANYMVPEALGVLDIILLHDDTIKENAMYATLQGATNAVLNRYKNAEKWFSTKALDDNKEALLWKAYISIMQDDSIDNIKNNYPIFKENISILRDYPVKIKNKLALQGLKIAVNMIDESMANDYTEVIVTDAVRGNEMAALLYYKGMMSALSGYFEQAFTLLDDVTKSNSMYYRALAIREKLKLEFKLNSISHMEVLKRLEQLRYSWRGDKFEYDVMNDLVDIYLRNEQYGEALRVLKDMIGIFKDKEHNESVRKRMEDIFENLYLNGVADKLSPVKAIGIYNDYKEITPSGDKGNEMIRRLADRMVAVDLLDQASDLLKNQIEHRLKGKSRAIIGARLALINIMNDKPEYAIKVLDSTEEKDMSPRLAEQRRLIEAKAHSATGNYEKAIDLIKDDSSEEAKLLKTEILWNGKKWNEVSEVLRSMIKKPVKGQPLENGQPGIILDWVTALKLAGRDKVLMRVRDNFGPFMKNTKFYDTFNLLTDVSDSGSAYTDFSSHIKSAEGFRSFMSSYVDKMKNEGLSEAIK